MGSRQVEQIHCSLLPDLLDQIKRFVFCPMAGLVGRSPCHHGVEGRTNSVDIETREQKPVALGVEVSGKAFRSFGRHVLGRPQDHALVRPRDVQSH